MQQKGENASFHHTLVLPAYEKMMITSGIISSWKDNETLKTTKNYSKREQQVDFVAVILVFNITGLEFGLTAAELAMLTRVAADKAKSKVFILASFFFYSQEKLSLSF